MSGIAHVPPLFEVPALTACRQRDELGLLHHLLCCRHCQGLHCSATSLLRVLTTAMPVSFGSQEGFVVALWWAGVSPGSACPKGTLMSVLGEP